jgi:GMP synthase-like glutamine amidotransferase
MQDRILIIDYGSQVTQLIARRIRETGVYSEIVPFLSTEKALEGPGLKGIILSGGPDSEGLNLIVAMTAFKQPFCTLCSAALPLIGSMLGCLELVIWQPWIAMELVQ